ncbi:uncharacterized protein METZ01_LOCUS69925 [marine metagenome]|uniref:Uncharacterized protein n=1 Tax=marine metagenome TaxID=408172 RepID=A0A381TNI1_9ZZZZ
MINILSLHKVIKQIINIPNMKIVVEASSLLVTAIRKINEGQNFISGKQHYYWVLIYYVIYYMLPDKNFVGITLQINQGFSDWKQYQRSCKIYCKL